MRSAGPTRSSSRPAIRFLSIDPLLAVHGVREAVVESDAPVVAISPIIGGVAVKGPAAEILASLGHDVSAIGVARLYAELADVFIIDEQDAALAGQIEAETTLRCVAVPTLMSGPAEKRALARAAPAGRAKMPPGGLGDDARG